MEFLASLLAKLGASIVSAIASWVKQSKLEAEAQRARALDEYIEGRRTKEQADQILREEAAKSVTFSYEAWEAMRTAGTPHEPPQTP